MTPRDRRTKRPEPGQTTFVGADAEATSALAAAVDAVVRFHASSDRLDEALERCTEFAVGHAYAAHLATLAGAPPTAASGERPAPPHHGDLPRRERQLVEILLLSARGEHGRAGYLAAEHLAEFREDHDALVHVDRWSRRHGPRPLHDGRA